MIPVATAAALQPFPHAAGAAASLLGLIQMGTGAVSAVIVGTFYRGTTGSMATVMLGLSVITVILLIIDKNVSEPMSSEI
jgi:DHA1 family bicyclomycin/chloramphenicol resistance-like MFS transporter